MTHAIYTFHITHVLSSAAATELPDRVVATFEATYVPEFEEPSNNYWHARAMVTKDNEVHYWPDEDPGWIEQGAGRQGLDLWEYVRRLAMRAVAMDTNQAASDLPVGQRPHTLGAAKGTPRLLDIPDDDAFLPEPTALLDQIYGRLPALVAARYSEIGLDPRNDANLPRLYGAQRLSRQLAAFLRSVRPDGCGFPFADGLSRRKHGDRIAWSSSRGVRSWRLR